jgi:hypothetical protein
MIELAVTSASSALAVLILYGAAVIFTLQSIGDRFSQALLPTFLLRRTAGWFVSLATLTFVGLTVIALPRTATQIVSALTIFCTSVFLGAVACYATWVTGSRVSTALALAHHLKPGDQRHATSSP